MTPFDELSIQDRAALTMDHVRAYCAQELMEKGVLVPVPPEILDETTPDVPTPTFFEPSYDTGYTPPLCIAFDTPEQAKAFLELGPRSIGIQYPLETKYEEPMSGTKIAPVELCRETDFLALKVKLTEAGANKTANTKAREEFNKAQRMADDAVSWIWEKYREAQLAVRKIERVVETFDEYLVMTNGNMITARAFLVKAHSEETVQAAIGDDGKPINVEFARSDIAQDEYEAQCPDGQLPDGDKCPS